MKCTGVAGRAYRDGEVSRRNPVISVVRRQFLQTMISEHDPYRLDCRGMEDRRIP